MIECELTKSILSTPVYQSKHNKSITSLSEVYQGDTIVYLNSEIGHLQTKKIENIEDYYDKQYEIFNQSEEDDVLYEIVDGKEIFRQQHQVDTLLSKVEFRDGMKVLDYGCAKGTVMKRLLTQKPHIYPYLFDVSQMYTHLWDRFLSSDRYASYQPKDEWENSFDLVTSFFAFEHIPDPIVELNQIKEILKKDGLFYCVVPNIFENIGDFVVADHVHHYSELSLRYLFAQAGFETISVDTKSHFAAFIIIGQKVSDRAIHYEIPQVNLAKTNQRYLEIADYWKNLRFKIKEFEQANSNSLSAIYGAGIYGNFIATCLNSFHNIQCFIDRNPLLKNTKMMQKPILHPDELPLEITTLYIGLNPKIARAAIADIDNWNDRNYKCLFL